MFRRSVSRRVELPPTDYIVPKWTGQSRAQALRQRQTYMNPVHFHNYAEPLMVVDGHMQYLFDETGRRYLDLFAGVTTVGVGHAHPRITKVAHEQAERLNHTTSLYLNPAVGEFCEAFAKRLPKGHDWVVHPVNSGSEANDFATLLARMHTKSYHMLAVRNGYHGFSEGSRGLISVPAWKHPLPPPPGIIRAMCPHPYVGLMGTLDDVKSEADLAKLVDKYVTELESVIMTETGGKNLAAFVAERIQGVGGAVPLLPGYLKKVYDVVRKHGGLCISDEVQCGYGRLGSHYWGFETEGVVPDIITSAKAVGNGWPVGVVACKREIAEALKGTLYFNTFGGGAVCMKVAREVLEIIDDEQLQQNCHLVGQRMDRGLKKLQEKHSIIGDVRVWGLLSGFELVKDRKTKEPAAAETAKLMELLKDEGMLVGKGGPSGNVIRLHPPMCVAEADVDCFLEAADKCLAKL